MTRKMTVALVVLGVVLGSARSAAADTFNVPGDYPTIQAAIDDAEDGDEIVVADGIHGGAGFNNVDYLGTDVIVRSASGDPALCIIQCEETRGFLFTSGETPAAVLRGFTVRFGDVADFGGAVYIVQSSPTIEDCVFFSNGAGTGGGAMYVNGGAPTISGCAFGGNLATSYGGALYINDGSPSITACSFDDNFTFGSGGAIYDISPGLPTVTDTTFTGNRAGVSGGAIHHTTGFVTGGVLSIDGGTFTGNSTTVDAPGPGGAIRVVEGTVEITGSYFSGNWASGNGGALSNAGGVVTVETSEFVENTAQGTGGGLTNEWGGAGVDIGTLALTDTEVFGNQADQIGGGVFAGVGLTTLNGCDVWYNLAEQGAGVHVSGATVEIDACDFSFNAAETFGGGIGNSGGTVTVTVTAFTSNTTTTDSGSATVEGGGAIANLDGGTLTATGSTFGANESADEGGGILNRTDAVAVLVACAFNGNTAAVRGGGLASRSESHGIVVSCHFEHNSANFAGGLSIGGGFHDMVDCVFLENMAAGDGGGSQVADTMPGVGSFRYIGCSFLGNEAQSGGGVNVVIAEPLFVNCVFSGNQAFGTGGAMNAQVDAAPTIVNSTMWMNVATVGGGIGESLSPPASLTVENSILWDNVPDQINVSIPPTVRYCDIEGGWSGPNLAVNPQFVDADGPDNIAGTLDDDVRLQAGSPCIDAADNTAVPPDSTDLDGDGNTTERTPYDRANLPRFVDDPATADTGVPDGVNPIVDIGAYEFQVTPTCPADLNGDGVVDVNDLLIVLGAWGTPGGDVNGDTTTDVNDLLIVLAAWGPCP